MEEQHDIHEFDKRVKALINRIQADKRIHNSNKKYLKEFLDYCVVSGMKKSSIHKDLYSLWFIASHLNKDFKNASKADFYGIIRIIEEMKWSEFTKRNHRVAIKKFMKWLKGNNKQYPEEVGDISTGRKMLKGFTPDDILEPKEVEKMINAADNIRNKTFVMFLALTGARIGEALNCKIKHCRFQDTGEVIIMLNGKTGFRTVVSIPLASQLATYIENGHPTKNPDDYLWLTNSNKMSGRELVGKRTNAKTGIETDVYKDVLSPLGYGAAIKILKILSQKAGIKNKRVSPHWFRRYSATQDASYMSDRMMMLKYGWNDSSTVGTYSKLSPQTLIEAERKRHGRSTESGKPSLTVIVCPRCRLDNPPASKFCSKCGMILSAETSQKIQKKQNEYDKFMTNPKNKKMILKFIEFMQKEKKS